MFPNTHSFYHLLTAPPKFDFTEVEDNIILKAGSAKVIEIPFNAHPMPEVKWKFNGGSFSDARRIKSETIYGMTSLTMAKVQRKDSGEYKLNVENKYGKATHTIKITVIGMHTRLIQKHFSTHLTKY